MADKTWLDTLEEWYGAINPSLARVEQGLNAADQWAAENGGALGGAVMRGMTDIPRAGIGAVGLGGKAIGGLVGGLSQDLMLFPEQYEELYRTGGVRPKPSLDERFGIMGESAEAGGEAAKENITALDVASMGAGGAAGAAKSLGLLKAARVLNNVDTALSAADAGAGAVDVGQGVSEGDWGRVAAGVGRMAGNAAGALGNRQMSRELGDIPGLERYDASIPLRKKLVASITGSEPTTMEAERPRHWEINEFGTKPPAVDPITGQVKPKERMFATRGRAKSRNTGITYTFEASTPEAVKLIKKLKQKEDVVDALTDMGDFVDMLTTAGADELVGRIGVARDAQVAQKGPLQRRGRTDLPEIYGETGNFRGFTFGGTEYGHTYIGLRDTTASKGQAFYLNPVNIAKHAKASIDFLMSPNLSDSLIDRATESLPDNLYDYIIKVRSGASRVPELDEAIGAELFRQKLAYTALHESLGHTTLDTGHGPLAPEYRQEIYDSRGQSMPLTREKQLHVDQKGMGGFEPAHNVITAALQEPTVLSQVKAVMQGESFQQKSLEWYRLLTGDVSGFSDSVAKRRDRVIGMAEARAAVREANAQMDEPTQGGGTTPPASVPPGSSSGAPQGPNLPPLAERLKLAFQEQLKAGRDADATRREIRTLQADAIRDLEEKLLNHEIDLATFEAERKRVMSGTMGLVNRVMGMAITPDEKQAMIERIIAQGGDDMFRRSRLQDSFNKVISGERLQDAELEDLRSFLSEKIADDKQDVLQRMGQFFSNTTGGIRAWRTAWDLSAPLRQALFSSIMNPNATKEAFKAQIQALRMSPLEFETFMSRLQDRDINPFADVAKAAGLHFSESMDKDVHSIKMEEAFSHGKWAEKLPGVRRSEQAYIAYLNKMRVELFNKHMIQFMEDGTPIFDRLGGVTQTVKDLAYMVNTLTGRGELSLMHISPSSRLGKKLQLTETFSPGKKTADQLHTALTSVFFAPRFQASRFSLMRDASMALVGGNLDPKVYKIYMKNLYGTIGAITATMGMLAATGVGTFETDPRKKDFGVLKVGNVRYDAYGSLKPWVQLFARMGEDRLYRHAPGGRHQSGEKNRYVWQFGKSKLAPTSSLLLSAITGEDYLGRPAEVGQLTRSVALPMIAETIYDVIQEGEADQLAAAVPASVLGIGVNAYGSKR